MTDDSRIQDRKTTPEGEPFYVFRAAGSDYEIGLAKGREMAADMLSVWEVFDPDDYTWVSNDPEEQRRTYRWLRRNLETLAPWMVEQMCGMADGSGVPIEKLFMTSHYGVLWCANGLFCSSVAVRHTDAGPLLGQNLDIGNQDWYFVEELHPAGAYATLSDGMAGMCWSPTGINEHGLAVGSSMLAAPPRLGVKPVIEGFPYHFLPRLVLRQCANVGEAVEFLKELTPVIPPGGGYQLNMVDRGGNMAVVDKIEDRTVIRQCEPDMNFTTNFSLDPELESWRTGGAPTEANYAARAESIRALFRGAGGAPSVEWMKSTLRGHYGDGRLCRHGTEETGGGGYSRLSLVYHPRTGVAEITNGWPCANDYQVFRINLK